MSPAAVTIEPGTLDLEAEALLTINWIEKFFDRTVRCFVEEDSGFAPAPGTYTVAAHVAHAAQVVDWFREGAFHGNWRMDFDVQIAEAKAFVSLLEAKTALAMAFARLRQEIAHVGGVGLAERLPDNPILPKLPRFHAIPSIVDHTAHHRGALAVCARLLGKTPLMPYGAD
jgi:uncharacterized damage-inducible protein DinB